MKLFDWIHRERDEEIAELKRALAFEQSVSGSRAQQILDLKDEIGAMSPRRAVLFEAAVGMAQEDVARVMAGKADHPLVVAVNQLLAEELAEAQTVASDPRVQADTHRVAHALGAVDACAQVRAKINALTLNGEDGG